MTQLLVWPRLSTCSKRAFIRTKKRWGHPYTYQPQARLLHRLTQELNMSEDAVLEQIQKERSYLLKYSRYYQ